MPLSAYVWANRGFFPATGSFYGTAENCYCILNDVQYTGVFDPKPEVLMRLSKARKACVTTMMKDAIFEAASSLLEQHGTGGLTMNRVATKVGFATASLYNYFRNKDDLIQYCYTRLVEPSTQAVEEVAALDLPARQKLERICRVALEYAVKHKGLIRLLAGMNYDSEIRRNSRPRPYRFSQRFSSKESRRAPSARMTPRIRAACFMGAYRSCSICRPAAHRLRRSTASRRP